MWRIIKPIGGQCIIDLSASTSRNWFFDLAQKYYRNEIIGSRESIFEVARPSSKRTNEGKSTRKETKVWGQIPEEKISNKLIQYSYSLIAAVIA